MNTDNIKIIILAGGQGERFGLAKQFVSVNNKPIFIHTLGCFSNYDKILVCPEEYTKIAQNNISYHHYHKTTTVINGGQTRQESVQLALTYLNTLDYEGKIIVTDANRPCITEKTIENCIKELETNDAVITVCKSINTSCLIDTKLRKILPRTNQYDLLMPQCFDFQLLYFAHENTKKKNTTDDVQILLETHPNVIIKILEISFWEGLKLTYPEDYKIFEILLKGE